MPQAPLLPQDIRKVNVIGHLNPDTDSICAAISYAYLKNQVDGKTSRYEARRCGTVNRETAFALKHFGFEEPRLITSVAPQIKDIEIIPLQAISPETSLHTAWNLMRDEGSGTLCVTDENEGLQGLIAVRDIANANMDILDNFALSRARTKYSNVLETLNGKMIVGDPNDYIRMGKLSIGTTPEMMDGLVDAVDHLGDLGVVDQDNVLLIDVDHVRGAHDAGVAAVLVEDREETVLGARHHALRLVDAGVEREGVAIGGGNHLGAHGHRHRDQAGSGIGVIGGGDDRAVALAREVADNAGDVGAAAHDEAARSGLEGEALGLVAVGHDDHVAGGDESVHHLGGGAD